MSNVLDFPKPDGGSTPGYLEITYLDGTSELIRCDEFVESSMVKGYIELWLTDPDCLVCFINLSIVKKIRALTEKETDGQ